MNRDTTRQELKMNILRITDLLYQNNLEKGIQEIPALIQVLAEFIPELQREDAENIVAVLKNVMGAMEMEDYILLADTLVYEVIPILG